MSIAKSKKVGEMYGNANEHIDRSTICSLIAFDMQVYLNWHKTSHIYTNCNKQLYLNSNICFLTKQKSPRQHCCLRVMVPPTGLEPVRVAPADFESATSANSITPACGNDTSILYRNFSFLSSIFNKALCQTAPLLLISPPTAA